MIQFIIPHPFKLISFVVWMLPISEAKAVLSKLVLDIVVHHSHT